MLDRPPRRKRRSTVIEGPDPVDIHVGARVKLRRTLVGLSQMELGGAIGLTFQQIQKYERGTNRISASMLHRIAEALDVPVSFFFDDMAEGVKLSPPTAGDLLAQQDSAELLRHFHRIPKFLRKQVLDLVKAMGREDD